MIRPEDPQFLALAESVLMTHQRGQSLEDNGSTPQTEETANDNDSMPMLLGTPEEIAAAVDEAVYELYFDWDEPTHPGIKYERVELEII
ncbi:MAG: hypothetical protein A2534_01120 [Candidatus Magasanikbacteria bacterium RIFOXYD2_FULL_39_9]|uniref:Uncharacterized protein n=1 Tax=Candidatus Magasanikbacteria bacterium RIFOXYD1_FULL_40_23 TaxID=1798705 RepID=A0A1F6PAS2_9BACT|nr:MAG: hypothetical protein A2534_01120 [Candidatus Magasanikbacteria bacterium RIFOXYD2_FULL_39_9]OGH93277.1 MAG: hypothetical protein A2563_01580 [Candidatus Magasanikbacteria bacterium RIFOXYD1_FULL_40_23]